MVSVFFAWTSKLRNNKHGLEISFLLIFLFTALRYNFGTDYSAYQSLFYEIFEHDTYLTLDSADFRIEYGWLLLNYLFKPLGFFPFIFIISVFFIYTYYALIKKYVPTNYYWLAVFIYIFFFNLFLIQLSAIRQTLSISIFLFSIKYIIEGRGTLKYILLIVFASFFHSSSLFLLFLALFNIPRIRNSSKTGYFILIIFVLLLFFGQRLTAYLPYLLTLFTGDRYTFWYESDIVSKISVMGSLLWFSLLYIVVYYSTKQTDYMKLFYNFCAIFFLVYPLTVLVFLSDRMGYYFAPFTLIIFPHILTTEQNKIKRFALSSFFIIFIMYNFFRFFTLDYVVEAQGYDDYRTIFSTF